MKRYCLMIMSVLMAVMICGVVAAESHPPTVYVDINDTQFAKQYNLRIPEGEDCFLSGRIDVQDIDGYAYQALVYICEGSEAYTAFFREALADLTVAYDGSRDIAGYLDTVRDNRIRNFGNGSFAAVLPVVIRDLDGRDIPATVVCVCGDEAFTAADKMFLDNVKDAYLYDYDEQ